MKSSIAIHWRLNPQRYQIAGTACPTCGHKAFPPRPECPLCADQRHSLSFRLPAQQPILAELPQLPLEENVIC